MLSELAFCIIGGLAGVLISRYIRKVIRNRPDPYDLNHLWDKDETVDEDSRDRDLVYCHVCGSSMPQNYATCPQCGNRLKG